MKAAKPQQGTPTSTGAAAATNAANATNAGYQTGFGNEFASEAVAGALPVGRNSPQRAPLGLYAELISGTAFTAPRHVNRRTWVYRIRPAAAHGPFRRIDDGALCTAPHAETDPARRPASACMCISPTAPWKSAC